MYQLRDYQEEGVGAVVNWIELPKKFSGVVVCPTGGGKSLYIAEIARRLGGVVLVLQPSKEILEQNYNKYISYGEQASIYSNSMKSREIGQVTFGTIGTVKSAAQEFKDAGLVILIVDECHIGTKKDSVMSDFIEAVGIKWIIGLTATPIELRQGYLQMITRSRKNLFNEIIHVTQVQTLVERNYWAKIKYQLEETNTQSLKLNSAGSDYTDASLIIFYDQNSLERKVINKVKDRINEGRKSILIFVPNIAASDSLSEKLNQEGILCGSVHSKIDKGSRNDLITGFRNLEIPVIVNVDVLSIGFDHPELDTIIETRPTKSFAVYYQHYGRGVRPHASKEFCEIIDFTENTSTFGKIEDIQFIQDKKGKWDMYNLNHNITGYVRTELNPTNTVPITTIWFGKYAGKTIQKVQTFDKGYLMWMIDPNKGFKADTPKAQNLVKQIDKLLNGQK